LAERGEEGLPILPGAERNNQRGSDAEQQVLGEKKNPSGGKGGRKEGRDKRGKKEFPLSRQTPFLAKKKE